MCIVDIIFIIYICVYIEYIVCVFFVHHLQVGKEDEEGDGDGRVGLMIKSH